MRIYSLLVILISSQALGVPDLFRDSKIKLATYAAEKGNPSAQNYLGNRFEHGLGLDKDLLAAEKWYQKAADQNFPKGLLSLALLFKKTNKSPQTILALTLKAAELGSPPAQNYLGMLYEEGTCGIQSHEEAARWYKLAADAQNAQALFNLARLYQIGLGVPKNYALAHDLYAKSSAKLPKALVHLGQLYEWGWGVPKNMGLAIKLYFKAADNGEPSAFSKLGQMFQYGLGVNQDHKRAFDLYQYAAEVGDVFGYTCLGFMYDSGLGVAVDHTKALELFQKASAAFDPMATCFLGEMYEHGRGGLTQDIREATRLYTLAKINGSQRAAGNLERLQRQAQAQNPQ